MTSNVRDKPGPDKLGTGADLLRRAAEVLRKVAEGATKGPWHHVDYAGGPDPETTFMGCGSIVTMHEDGFGGPIAAPSGDLYPRGIYSPFEDMVYIALVHPPVALALAEVMNRLAKVWSHTDGIVCDLGEALARAVLREGES